MKAFFITTQTNETYKHYESFESLGNEVRRYIYTNGSRRQAFATGDVLDGEIHAAAVAYAPDIIVYIGAAGGNVPSIPLFRRLNTEVAPTIHFCSDAGDDPWWPLLMEYDKAKCFALQVALDGSHKWPLNASQLSALTVISPDFFKNGTTPHSARPILFGFAGNPGGSRAEMIKQLQGFGMQVRLRDNTTFSYPGFADYMCQCRMTINFAWTGSGRHLHVKGRVIESGYAGVLLLEPAGSPTKEWFTPGADYLEYNDAAHAKALVDHYANRPDESQAIADKLAQRVRNEHSPAQFWARVLERIPLKVKA